MITETFRPSESYEQALDRAARLWGIEPEYRDTWGKRHITPPEVKQGILNALDIAAGTREALDRAMEERLWREWDRLVPPVEVISSADWARGFPLHLPAALAAASVSIRIRWEDGGVERCQAAAAELKDTARAELAGATFVRKAVPLRRDPPLGYHEVEVQVHSASGQKQGRMRLIVCPDRAWSPPCLREGQLAGLAISLYSLRSKRNWGCGDFTDLEGIVDWLAEQAAVSFIGLNPLHAIANRQPFNTSPYLPNSIFYKNLLYLDPERVEDFQQSRRVLRYFSLPEIQGELACLRASELVEYERVQALKLRTLKLCFGNFLAREYRRETPRALEFLAYSEREGELLDRYALWCALDESIHRHDPAVWVWPQWPAQYQDPDSAATRAFAKKHWRAVLFHKYAQWEIERQLEAVQQYARRRGLSIGLYHDLALATDRCGSDLWAWHPYYVSGCRVGAPPDGFSPKGQDWAFPPPNAEHHRENGYEHFADSIRKNTRHAGALRIDHVMRFFRLYWIPEGMDPQHGAYVRDRHEDLLRILALESVRQQVLIVGEDLGTVTPEIRQALDRFGLLGYRVPYFEKTERGELKLPSQYAEQALVASSTHDLPTLAGFWQARDVEARRQTGLLPEEAYRHALAERARDKQKLLDALFELRLLPDWFPRRAEQVGELTGELHNALVGWLVSARSRLMALTQEDLIKDTEQQNLPATTSEYPNWRRKMRYTVEQLHHDRSARDYTTMFRHWLERSGRLNGVTVPAQGGFDSVLTP